MTHAGSAHPAGATGPGRGGAAEEPSSLRERKKLRNHQALHEAARDLVLERGLADVNIDEICARAGLSPRTFFNYFPTKASAVIDYASPRVGPEVQQRFAERCDAEGLLAGTCLLIALTLPHDRLRSKDLMSHRPELAPAIHAWMAELRSSILATVASRADDATARLAVALVIAALSVAIEQAVSDEGERLAASLLTTVRAMQALRD